MSVVYARVLRADLQAAAKASRQSASAPSQAPTAHPSTEEETSELRLGAAQPHANVTTASAALTVATSSPIEIFRHQLFPLSGARGIATLARSGQQACAGTCALRHHSRHNSAPALPPPSDDVRWGQSTPASSLIAREARPLAAASDLRRRLDRRWPRWRPT